MAALLTACSEGEPTAVPSSSSAATRTITATAAPTKLAPLWEKRLPALSPRSACPSEAMFKPDCLQAILDFRKTIEEIGDQADAMDNRYVVVERAVGEVGEAIEEWTTVCVTTPAGSSERVRCLQPWNTVLTGSEKILLAIHKVESS
ncbi:hypothetical protein AB0I60_04485 [Actinosynnema sp. NPDC050436]|uniref:hypothetical protein n=1 Tax=Actinosynnema sp. NPDC050436 TaxID=3155659 RepID=UPI0033E77073